MVTVLFFSFKNIAYFTVIWSLHRTMNKDVIGNGLFNNSSEKAAKTSAQRLLLADKRKMYFIPFEKGEVYKEKFLKSPLFKEDCCR